MTRFPSFAPFVRIGDYVQLEIGSYSVMARIEQDDCPDAPDQRQEGFWPSLDRKNAGFIGEDRTISDYAAAQSRAEAVIQGWRDGDWFYCGIVLSVACNDVILAPYAASLWGIEANHPLGDGNVYLCDAANTLLDEAMRKARLTHTELCAALARAP